MVCTNKWVGYFHVLLALLGRLNLLSWFCVAQIVVPLQKCDFETLDRIKVEYVLNWIAISSDFLNVI